MQLIYEKLPKDISERHVLLLDPVLATGEVFNFDTAYLSLDICTFYSLSYPCCLVCLGAVGVKLSSS